MLNVAPANDTMAGESPVPANANAGERSVVAGLVVKNNQNIRAFLLAASSEKKHLPGELQDIASDLALRSQVPYRSLRAVWSALPTDARPSISSLFSDVEFLFSSPKPREKSEELKKRLKKLADMAERKEYDELVKDVAPRMEKTEPLSSYKDQIGFGLHVVLIMFTGYLIGFASFRALFNHSEAMNAAGGILGIVCGMLLETVLFIIRASSQEMISSNSNSSSKKLQ
ncbi:hypothetical protein HPP92_020518 [Vanilla planifolia]|uniref:Uncharacterized protein n=1 Tax=Vanilla planifolia TaxID=51239 RepID=A0A835PUG4_VANPL|nr:hypothetical protein HPP92_020908 [Vanilla planifolia]KAG0462042.1 hypothetical protein HPP92_020518 [Vanilla planifolia]